MHATPRPRAALSRGGRRASARWARAAALLLLLPLGCSRPPARTHRGPPRLVSTAPNLTECLFAIGAGELLVGRTESCDYPPGARLAAVPAVGGFGTPWLEPLLAQRPTHVLESVLADPDAARRLAALGVETVHVPCARLDDVPPALRQLGALTGRPAEAERLAARLADGFAAARAALADARAPRPRVFLLLGEDTPVTAGPDTFLADLVRLAGGAPVGAELQADYSRVSLEWLLAQDPDLILCLFETPADAPPAARFASRTGWRALQAVRNGRVYAVPDLGAVCRPGPRVLDGLAQFARLLQLDARLHPPSAPPRTGTAP